MSNFHFARRYAAVRSTLAPSLAACRDERRRAKVTLTLPMILVGVIASGSAATAARTGSVAGSGWLDSPPGAHVPQPHVRGRAEFTFAMHESGGDLPPAGHAEFRFAAADLHFVSSDNHWLVVVGGRATFKVVGALNGSGDHELLVTVIDGDTGLAREKDRVRIRIVEASAERLIYDNHAGAPPESDAATPIGGGSIVVQRTAR